jgi:hypothetical protein
VLVKGGLLQWGWWWLLDGIETWGTDGIILSASALLEGGDSDCCICLVLLVAASLAGGGYICWLWPCRPMSSPLSSDNEQIPPTEGSKGAWDPLELWRDCLYGGQPPRDTIGKATTWQAKVYWFERFLILLFDSFLRQLAHSFHHFEKDFLTLVQNYAKKKNQFHFFGENYSSITKQNSFLNGSLNILDCFWCK